MIVRLPPWRVPSAPRRVGAADDSPVQRLLTARG